MTILRPMKNTLLVILLFCCSVAAQAEHDPAKKTVPQPEQSALTTTTTRSAPDTGSADLQKGCDVVLLMDSSGSMKRTDPKNYRKGAAKLLISLLGEDDNISVMSFGDSAVRLAPLMLNKKQNRTQFFSAVDRITSREYSTNITDAVQKGFDELKSSKRQERIIIMMSDGKLALGAAEKDTAALEQLKRLLPELAQAKVKLYTVAFTEESDSVLLSNMAKETGGFFRYAREDKDVHLMFASLFEKLKSPDAVPFEGEAFTVDSEIKEATVLVTKNPGTVLSLVDPSGKKNTASKHADTIEWYPSSVFDMITIQEPAPGKWSVKLSVNEGNRVYVLTNLSLRTSFDRSFVHTGETVGIEVWIEKQGGIVTEQSILESTAFSAEIAGPDAKSFKLDLVSAPIGTATPATGKYTARFTSTAVGAYTMTLLARGKTFKRTKTVLFTTVEKPAAPPAESKPAPRPATEQPAPKDEEVSWGKVLAQFVIVNLLIALFTGAGYVIWRKASKARGSA
jgi:Mg-chelatase subunit ChlD